MRPNDVSRRCLDDELTGGRPDGPRLYRDIDARQWRDLFDTSMLDDLIHGTALRRPYFYLVKDGSRIPINRYTRSVSLLGGTVGGVANPESLYREVADGASLVLLNLEHLIGSLRRFCASLSAVFADPVDIGAYVTPPSSAALPTHFDHQDVIILQCYGSKCWSVYERVAHAPTLGQQVSIDPTSEVLAATLTPGTSLYLPAGTPHHAETNDELSIHLTVGVTPVRRRDLLKATLEPLLRDPELDAVVDTQNSAGGGSRSEWIDDWAGKLQGARVPRDQFVSPLPDSQRFTGLTRADCCRSLVWCASSEDIDLRWGDDGEADLMGDGWVVHVTSPVSELVESLLARRCVPVAELDRLTEPERNCVTRMILRGLIAADDDNNNELPGPSGTG